MSRSKKNKQTPDQAPKQTSAEPKTVAKYTVHEGALYERFENELFTSWKKHTFPPVNPKPVWKGPLIPFDMWHNILSWCYTSWDHFRSETMCFLYFNETDKVWVWGILPQKTKGMTVSADPSHPRQAEIRKQLPDLQFGTVHHHCTSGAFASGTDQDDEKDREGLHFTIGNMDKDILSLHCRLTLGGVTTTLPSHQFISPSPQIPADLPKTIQQTCHEAYCTLRPPLDKEKWTPYFELVTRPAPVVSPSWQNSYTPGYFSNHYSGFGAGVNHQQPKKTNGSGLVDERVEKTRESNYIHRTFAALMKGLDLVEHKKDGENPITHAAREYIELLFSEGMIETQPYEQYTFILDQITALELTFEEFYYQESDPTVLADLLELLDMVFHDNDGAYSETNKHIAKYNRNLYDEVIRKTYRYTPAPHTITDLSNSSPIHKVLASIDQISRFPAASLPDDIIDRLANAYLLLDEDKDEDEEIQNQQETAADIL